MQTKIALILAGLLICCHYFTYAQADDEPKPQHGISFSCSYIGDTWQGFEAPVFFIGYRKFKDRKFYVAPHFSAGAGIIKPGRWDAPPSQRRSYVVLIDAGMVTTLDLGNIAIRNYLNITTTYSPEQWGWYDINFGPSATFAIGTGRNLPNAELNLILPGLDLLFLGADINPASAQIEIDVATIRVVGINFIYYFPEKK